MLTTTNANRKRREEISVPKFKALITTPAVVPFKMPAPATLGVRKATAITQGDGLHFDRQERQNDCGKRHRCRGRPFHRLCGTRRYRCPGDWH